MLRYIALRSTRCLLNAHEGLVKSSLPALAQRSHGHKSDSSSSDDEGNFHFHMHQHVPRPLDDAPEFHGKAVVNRQFKDIKLADYKDKWLILFFYPLDFTFVCPTEIVAFSDRADEFHKLGCEVVACSTDSHFSHLAWINTPRKDGGLGDMKIPVLADYNKTISRQYGVLLNELGAALRGLFLIDPKGKIRHITINDLPVGRSVDEALRLVKAFQFVEKHGEVCPADWKESSPTINPAKAKEYFNKVNK